MSLDDQYQLDFYDNDVIALSNESNISENPNDPDIESNSSSPEQSTSQNNGVTVITNSLGDRFNIKEVDDLINKAKTINNFVNWDKYHEKLRRLQAELNPQHPVNPFQVILELLSCHLRDFYPTIMSITVKACCCKINESMLSRWFEPSLNSLIASFLDPRFKKISYVTSAKKNETLTYLYTLNNNQERSTSIQETEPSSANSSFFASFYDDDNNILITNENSSLVEKENLHILYKQSQGK
ncbi:2873_t:CDS:2 [Racocetra fulgida]|uniref:2873_t:CDS:1 n=1 Tax=Racocetra fulgida TaxID=60492 RepID=A0A9N8ZRB3_9GLOM|nr:2873_t:CDS:2 [Racocetra fulgida]